MPIFNYMIFVILLIVIAFVGKLTPHKTVSVSFQQFFVSMLHSEDVPEEMEC